MKIRRRIAINGLAVLILFIALGAVASAGETEFSAVGAARELKGAPGIYEWTFAATVGKSPFDKIALHRVAKGPTPPAHPEAVVLYLPGTNMNGEVALEDPRYSFQVYLAEQGVDVWAMDYRTHFIPPQTPQSDLSELGGMDQRSLRDRISTQPRNSSAKKPAARRLFVAGFSRGVEFAYLYAAMHPERVAGIIALDGFIPHPSDASGAAAGRPLCRRHRRRTSDLRQALQAHADGDRESRSACADSQVQDRARKPRARRVRCGRIFRRPRRRSRIRRAAFPTPSCWRNC